MCVWCKYNEQKNGNAYCKLCGKQINKEQIIGNRGSVIPLYPCNTPRWCPNKKKEKL